MEDNKEYYAFISYKREDEKWAKWLQDKLEHYKFPTNLNGRADLPKNIRPTFRDVTDLKPGLLAEEINNALVNSQWLIIVCSPRSAKSPWVCKEAQTFIDLGRADHIIPFVIEGNPFSEDIASECYPEALLHLTGSQELLAANINEMGRDAAVIKVVARMFGLKFDSLWQRYERERRRKRFLFVVGALTLAFAGIVIGTIFYKLNADLSQLNDNLIKKEKIIEQKNTSLIQDSILLAEQIDSIHIQNARLVAQQDSIAQAYVLLSKEKEKLLSANNKLKYRESILLAKESESLIEKDSYMAQRLALMALPYDYDNPQMPFSPTAEKALRTAYYSPNGNIGTKKTGIVDVKVLESTSNRKDSTEHVFMSVDSTIYHVDLDLGERTELFSMRSCNFDYIPFRYGSYGSTKIGIATLSDDTLTLWMNDNGVWRNDDCTQIDYLLPIKDMDGKNRLVKLLSQSKIIIERNDSIYLLQRIKMGKRDNPTYGKWRTIQKMKGGEWALGTPDKYRNWLNVLAINDNNNNCIYIYEPNAKRDFICVDTLETAGQINEMALGGSQYWYWLVATGSKGVHVYQKNYGNKANDTCWHWKHHLSSHDFSSHSKLIMAGNQSFYIVQNNTLYLYKYDISNDEWGKKIITRDKTNDVGDLRAIYIRKYGGGFITYLTGEDFIHYENLTKSSRKGRVLSIAGHGSEAEFNCYMNGPNCFFPWIKQRGDVYQLVVDSSYSLDRFGSKSIAFLDKHTLPIIGVSYSNGHILSVSDDSTLHIWHNVGQKFECLGVIKDSSFAKLDSPNMSIDKEGRTISIDGTVWRRMNNNEWSKVFYDEKYYVRDLISNQINVIAPKPILSNDGAYIYWRLQDTIPSICLYDSRTQQNRIIGHPQLRELLVGSPNAKAAAGVNPINRNITLYNFEDGNFVSTVLEGHTDQVYSLNFSPDGKYMVSSSADSTIRIWNVKSKICVEVLTSSEAPFCDVKFTDNGRKIIAVGKNPYGGRPIAVLWEFLPIQELMEKSRRKISKTTLTPSERSQYLLE